MDVPNWWRYEREFNTRLFEDQWFVIGIGVSQVPMDAFTAEGNHWTASLDLAGDYRILAIPPAANYCLASLSSVPGMQFDLVREAAFGGSLHLDAPYGISLQFRPTKEPLAQTCLSLGWHDGLLTLDGERIELEEETDLRRSTYDRTRLDLVIDHWDCHGLQFLEIIGMPLPCFGGGAVRSGGCKPWFDEAP